MDDFTWVHETFLLGICKISTWVFITVAAVALMVYHCYSIIHTYAKVGKTTKYHSERSETNSLNPKPFKTLTGPSQCPIWDQRTTILGRDGFLIVWKKSWKLEMYGFSTTIYPHRYYLCFATAHIDTHTWRWTGLPLFSGELVSVSITPDLHVTWA